MTGDPDAHGEPDPEHVGEGDEQGGLVSVCLIPSIKPISIVYFGLTENVGNS